MELWEIALTGLSLAMDAFAVSMCKGVEMKKFIFKFALVIAGSFAFFQMLMPLIGWGVVTLLREAIESGSDAGVRVIEQCDHWIAFAILAFLGGRMVRESFKEEECRHEYDPTNLRVVTMLAIATSIDALAIGVSFAFLGMKNTSDIIPSVGIIGFVSLVLSLMGLGLGIRFGCGITKRLKPDFLGGIILIIIGIKILVEHLIQHYG